MDNLRSAIADKVLDISALNGDDMKMKLEKINRFRDFVNACQSLIKKYPAIEDELLRMVENNDFDSRIASSRVDTIIRLSDREGEGASKSAQVVADDIENLEKITEEIIHSPIQSEYIPPVTGDITTSSTVQPQASSVNDFVDNTNRIGADANGYSADETKSIGAEEEKIGQYVDFEEIDENSNLTSFVDNSINPVVDRKPSIQIEEDNKKKDTVKKILQVCAIAVIIVALIFIIKFVINNWLSILYGLGAVVLVGGIIYFLLKKKKSEE